MNFSQATAARRVLRTLAGEPNDTHWPITKVASSAVREKRSGVLDVIGGAARGIGRGTNWAWQKSMQHNGPVMGTIGLGLGAAGIYSLGKHVINRTRATYNGFDPNVQAYTRQTPY